MKQKNDLYYLEIPKDYEVVTKYVRIEARKKDKPVVSLAIKVEKSEL